MGQKIGVYDDDIRKFVTLNMLQSIVRKPDSWVINQQGKRYSLTAVFLTSDGTKQSYIVMTLRKTPRTYARISRIVRDILTVTIKPDIEYRIEADPVPSPRFDKWQARHADQLLQEVA